MRNLLKTHRHTVAVEDTISSITASAWDVSTDSLICAFESAEGRGLVELLRATAGRDYAPITSWEVAVILGDEATSNRIVSLFYLTDTSSTCVIFSGGDIVLVREQDAGVEVEIVGSIESGISATAWSPDEEVLAIATKSRTLLLLTREFEPIEEVKFSVEDQKASRHVSVGWGKAETQFQGKHAKTQGLRDPTVPAKVDSGVLSPQDDARTVITWRGDGAYLAVSTIEDQERRVVRVYSREGQLDSVSEPVDGLESPLSWRPAGNVIAGIQRRFDRVDVVFFERNGLRHGEFTLKTGEKTPSSELKINSIHWNGDSSVLAVCLADRVQLWSTGNYHWYLKQEVMLSSYSTSSTENKYGFQWHPEKPLQFVITSTTTVDFNSFVWTNASGPLVAPNDFGVVGVVDGDKLKLTPIRVANIPPPMSYCEAKLDSTPVDVAISPSGTRITVLQHSGVDLIDWDFKSAKDPEVTRSVFKFPSSENFRQVCFLDEETICLLGESAGNANVLRQVILSDKVDVNDSHVLTIDASVCTFRAAGELGGVLCQDQTGIVARYDFEERADHPVCALPAKCPWMDAVILEGQIVVFGLSEAGRLYANERHLAPSCTSFAITDAHLIFTTSQHVIKFVHLTSSIHDLEVPSDEASGNDERCRNIERGSRLVSVMPSTFSLVLQMPRGNLETIYPRALVLAGVRRSIEARNYKKAFLACRNNRVDLNLLHDYAPAQFLECIELLVSQLKEIEHIDLVLSQLREEDVTKSMYRETLPSTTSLSLKNKPAATGVTNKVNTICNAFIGVLRKKHLSKHMQNIITAYVCKTPPDHESALGLITSLKGKDLYEQAITHICFLSDIDKLYDTALGIYDLEISIMIAQQAQKDPREYLPFLQSLQEMPELRRRFIIDDKLGRYSKALKSLFDMGGNSFEETRNYVAQKELYTEALQLYKYAPDHTKAIMRDYADFLHARSRFKEAGFAYEFLGETALAIESYQNAGQWEECLFVATRAQEPDISSLAASLAETLTKQKLHRQAATIHLSYLSDVPAAATALCAGTHYSEAMRTVVLHNQPTLLTSIIDPALTEAFASSSSLLAECRGQLKAQTSRIVELREKATIDPLAYLDAVTEADAPDNVSLAPTNASTSGASLFTRYTGASLGTAQTGETRKTSKNRRKDERKRARGKKGSVYEEEYLVNSVRRLVERVDSVRGETTGLVEAMFRRGMRESAGALQQAMVELLEMLKEAVPVIFVPHLTEGGQAVKVEVPVVREFEGLSLV